MINPRCLCSVHLRGEHGEMHKHLPSFRKRHRVDGRFSPVVQIQFNGFEKRHDDLAAEMLRRGMNHKSPLIDIPSFAEIYPKYYNVMVDIDQSIKDLCERCELCRKRILTDYIFI